MRHKVNINCTLWVYCSNDITRLYWPFQPARESFIYGIFALCKVCGSKRLIIESLEPKKIILFLEQRLMFCKMMLRHKWFLSHPISYFLFPKCWSLFSKISVHLKSGHVRVRSTWLRPGLSACKDLRSEEWMQLYEKKWVHGHKMPGRHISSKHEHWVRISFFERWNASMILNTKWAPACTCRHITQTGYRYYYPIPSQYAANELRPMAIINSLSKCSLPTHPDLCQGGWGQSWTSGLGCPAWTKHNPRFPQSIFTSQNHDERERERAFQPKK